MATAETQGNWYIVKQASGQCAIVQGQGEDHQAQVEGQTQGDQANWGPFPSQSDAIARRVGLIRAGKCKPA